MPRPRILTKVIADTYSCFLIAKKSAEEEPEIALTTAKTARILRIGTIASQPGPNKTIVISLAKSQSINP